MSNIYAAAAKRVITPDLTQGTVFLAGFQQNRPATGVHDDLYVRVLVIRTDDHEGHVDFTQPEYLILAVCDLIGLSHIEIKQIRRLIQQQGIDTRGLVVACTHTHSGPDTLGLWGQSSFGTGLNPRYQAFVRQQVVSAVKEAIAALEPATLHAGTTQMLRWLKNARAPDVIDRELSVLQAANRQDKTIFTFVNLACHPEVMFGENTLISADYAGAVCRQIEQDRGGIALFASADIGGMMTPDVDEHERSFETVQLMGRDVASFALAALAKGKPVDPPSLYFCRCDVHIPMHNPLFKFALATGALPRLPRDDQGRVSTQVSFLDLGPMRWITVPGELLPRPGMMLRQMLNAPYRFLIGLADDELGYLIPSSEFIYPPNPFKPGAHYEETMSLSKYALPLLMEAWTTLLSGKSSH